MDVNKVTKSAQSVVRLVESLTARYQLLPRAKYRLQFFSQVHLHILQVYFDKINRMIDQQEHVFNTATKLHDEVQKVGLYCRLVSSLMFIVGEMGRWEAEPVRGDGETENVFWRVVASPASLSAFSFTWMYGTPCLITQNLAEKIKMMPREYLPN